MPTVYSEDGVTVTKLFTSKEPQRHWVQDTPLAGHYEEPTIANGFYELVLVESPSVDHDSEIVRQGDQFVQVWTFSQEAQDARLVREAADAQNEADQVERQAELVVLRPLIVELAAIIDGTTTDTVPIQVRKLARMVRRLAKDSFGGA